MNNHDLSRELIKIAAELDYNEAFAFADDLL